MKGLRGPLVLALLAIAGLAAGSAPSSFTGLLAGDPPAASALVLPPAVSSVLAALPDETSRPPATPSAADAPSSPDPSLPPRVGIQAGHWQEAELPEELARLRANSGGSGGGHVEVDVNLAIAQRVVERLGQSGIVADLLPATVPPNYRGDAFVALHADASTSAGPRGFKLARARRSALPATDDVLLADLQDAYGAATGLPLDTAVTPNMTGYYAFNNLRYEHAVALDTPAVILEMGYLTSAADRELLVAAPDSIIEGIVSGIERFLRERPPPAERERPLTTIPAIRVGDDGATVRAEPRPDAPETGRLEGGRTLTFPERVGDWYRIGGRPGGGAGWVDAAAVEVTEVPRSRR